MNRVITLAAIGLSVLALGCGGGGNSPVLSSLADSNPTLQALGAAVTPEGFRARQAGEISEKGARQGRFRGKRGGEGQEGGHRGHGGDRMKLLDDPCAQVTGSPKEGGSAIFTGCVTRGGTLTGNVTWSGDQDASENGFNTSSSKQLSFVPNGEGKGLPELGPAGMWAKSQGIQLLPDAWDRADITSNSSMSGTKGDRESFSRTGTTSIAIFNGGTQVRTIEMQSTRDQVTLTIDGQTHVIDLSQLREQFKQRMSDREFAHGEKGDWKQHREKQTGRVDAEAGDSTVLASNAL